MKITAYVVRPKSWLVEATPIGTFVCAGLKKCSGGGDHVFQLKPIPVRSTTDRYSEIVCIKCGFELGQENMSLRIEILRLARRMDSVNKAAQSNLRRL